MTTRTASELNTALAEVAEDMSFIPDSRHFLEGVTAALEWVTGQRRYAPTDADRLLPFSDGAAYQQLDDAVEMIYGRLPSNYRRDHLVGVEGALRWVLGISDQLPY